MKPHGWVHITRNDTPVGVSDSMCQTSSNSFIHSFVHSFIAEMMTSYPIFRNFFLALRHRSEEGRKLRKKGHKTLILLFK
jgi:hypothetical protein